MKMAKTNRLIFKYPVDLPDGGRRLHTSSVCESICHESYEDMRNQIIHTVAGRIGILGTILIQTSPSGQVVDEHTYDHVVADKDTLAVYINDVQSVTIGAFWQ